MADEPPATASMQLETVHGVFHAPPDDLITNQFIKFGAHTRNELAMVLSHIGEGETVVDLGAHIGSFAIPIAKKLGPRGRLLAVEGSVATHEVLLRNIEANSLADRIQPICAIVGNNDLKNLRRIEVSGNTGAGYYVQDKTSGNEAVDALALLAAHGFSRPDFIKIDIEGMELFVLRALAPLFAEHRPKLYIEIADHQLARHGASAKDVDEFLRSFGYKFHRNIGERNSANDEYLQAELASVVEGGSFFDLLALPG